MGDYIFWNVDTQKDYFDGGFKIPSIENIINNLNDITQFARLNNVKVVNTAGWYTKDNKQLSDNPNYTTTFPYHCMVNTDGAKFIKETQPTDFTVVDWANPSGLSFMDIHRNRELAITKSKLDMFEGNSYSESILHNLGVPIKQRPIFVVYGVNVGITVLSLLKRGYEVIVVMDANRSYNGTPLKESDIIQEAPNPYPDQVYVKQNTNLSFITTENLLKKQEH